MSQGTNHGSAHGNGHGNGHELPAAEGGLDPGWLAADTVVVAVLAAAAVA
ncbi:MAG TPA: hypothetical protein VIG75_12305 [Citricoccus sp.]